jgi:hypothetical protein
MERNIRKELPDRPEPAHQLDGLDVVASETGGAGFDGLNISPGASWLHSGQVPDYQEQVDYSEPRYRVIASLPWFKGAMEWFIQMRNPPYVDPNATIAPDIRDTPIEKAVRFWFADLDGNE